MRVAASSSWWQRLRHGWQQSSLRWMNQRLPPQRSATLGLSNIFILPTAQGLGFLLLLVLMYLAGINYELNLATALVYWLLGLFVLALFHTYRNLHALQLRAVAGAPVFANTAAEVVVTLQRSERRCHESLWLGFAGGERQTVNVLESAEASVRLSVPAPQRGWLSPGRLRIETVFPLGIFRAWSLPDLACRILVYPAPIACNLATLRGGRAGDGKGTVLQDQEDFHGLRDYRPSDSPRQIAWKVLARGQGLYSKEFATPSDETVHLHWDQFDGLGVEQRLSRLCGCVLQLEAAGVEYSMALPGVALSLAHGPLQRAAALQALALFGSEEAGKA